MANEEIKDQGGVYMAIFQIWGKVDTWWSCKHRGEHKPQLEQECIQASNSSRRTFYKLYQALGASKVELTSRHKKTYKWYQVVAFNWMIDNESKQSCGKQRQWYRAAAAVIGQATMTWHWHINGWVLAWPDCGILHINVGLWLYMHDNKREGCTSETIIGFRPLFRSYLTH